MGYSGFEVVFYSSLCARDQPADAETRKTEDDGRMEKGIKDRG